MTDIVSPDPADTGTAKLFMHGRSQAVRLPKAFRLEGREVRVRRVGQGLLLEPISGEVNPWFDRLDAYTVSAGEFMAEGRDQPKMPEDRAVFDN